MAGEGQAPPGFIFNAEFGDYENPQTGEWFDPDSGQVFAADAPPTQPSSSPGNAGNTATGALLAHELIPSAPSAAPAASGAATATAGAPTVTGAGTIGSSAPAASGAGTLPTAAPGPGFFAPGGAAAQTGGAIAGAYTGYQQLRGAESAIKNKPMSLQQQAALALPTFGTSLLYNPVRKFFGSSKGKAQLARDSLRKDMMASGFIGPDYKATLSSGASLDFGKDGGARLKNVGTNIDGKGERHYHDVDFSRSGSDRLTAGLDPLGEYFAQEGGHGKRRSDMTGYLVNLAQSGGDERGNAMEEIERAGLDHDKLYGWVHMNEKLIGKERADSYKNSLDELYSRGAYEGGNRPSSSNGGKSFPGAKSASLPQPAAAAGGRVRISPGVYKDAKGTYLSKSGERGR